ARWWCRPPPRPSCWTACAPRGPRCRCTGRTGTRRTPWPARSAPRTPPPPTSPPTTTPCCGRATRRS
ncbi:unnamed protein product, partial [Heterosigma akashiwo]